MAINTTKWSPAKTDSSTSTLSVPERIANLKIKHQPIFDAIGKTNVLFFPKMAYRPKGKDEKYVSFFVSELKRGNDIYTEFVSRDYTPEDPDRNLYLWRFNPHWQTEYESVGEDVSSARFLIPVSELTRITLPGLQKEKEESKVFKFDDSFDISKSVMSGQDAPISELTIKDLAAMLLVAPVSDKEWLNDLIKKH